MRFSTAFDIESRTINKKFSRRASSGVIACLLVTSALLFAGCGDADDNDTGNANKATVAASPSVPSKGLITAAPNPIPAGGGELAKTKISWNTKTDMGPVSIFVSTNGEPEVKFAESGQEGSAEAAWIQAASVYDFRLYVGAGANRQLLDHVEVTRK
ncbi:MAG TPA: hypothetical protein VJ842_19840 [Pyrinomonadaceae bacterium]|nr:hypothetical protein [Pyrinomonadaceae bacterium]